MVVAHEILLSPPVPWIGDLGIGDWTGALGKKEMCTFCVHFNHIFPPNLHNSHNMKTNFRNSLYSVLDFNVFNGFVIKGESIKKNFFNRVILNRNNKKLLLGIQ